MDINDKIQVLTYMFSDPSYFEVKNNKIVWINKKIKSPSDEEILKVFKSDEYKKRVEILNTRKSNFITHQLAEIDLKSIRSIREWLSSQPDAPKFIKDYEKQAKETRKKLK